MAQPVSETGATIVLPADGDYRVMVYLFRNEARCSTCHEGPRLTDVLSGPDPRVPFLHDPAEVGMDPAYAKRSARGGWQLMLPPSAIAIIRENRRFRPR